MKSIKLFAIATFSLAASLASAQFAGGGQMMAQGTFGNYQPTMQPGAYQTAASTGPGEQVAYQQGNVQQNCTPRGNASAIEGPISNGNVIAPGQQQHNR